MNQKCLHLKHRVPESVFFLKTGKLMPPFLLQRPNDLLADICVDCKADIKHLDLLKIDF